MQVVRPLCLLLTIASSPMALAGIVPIPSDIGVTLAALPATDLQAGQPIDMTLSVTNFGPEAEPLVVVNSTVFVDEFNVVSSNLSECTLNLVVSDLQNGDFEYNIQWTVAGPGGVAPPMAAGETRTCHFQIALTRHAPPTYTFGFDLFYVVDPNPSNDSSSVLLQRELLPAQTPVPTLSIAMLCLLASLSAGFAVWRVGLRAARLYTLEEF